MRKKVWEMVLGIVFALVLLYQISGIDDVKAVCGFPKAASSGSRVRAKVDVSGIRGKTLVLRISYDGGVLAYCGRAGAKLPGGSLFFVREQKTGAEENALEVSVSLGEWNLGRGSVILEFYAKQGWSDVPIRLEIFDGESRRI